MSIHRVLGRIVLVVVLFGGFIYPTAAGVIKADTEPIDPHASARTASWTDTALVAMSKTPSAGVNTASATKVAERMQVRITAYSSSVDETDDTPFTTAMNSRVRDGVIAANFLPFRTRVRIPSLFGDKIFVVEDRMHTKNANVVDIWMPSKQTAIQFGFRAAEIEILN